MDMGTETHDFIPYLALEANNDGNTGRVILTDTDGYFDIVKDSQTE